MDDSGKLQMVHFSDFSVNLCKQQDGRCPWGQRLAFRFNYTVTILLVRVL